MKIGRFELREQIGKGATSSVYLADDPFANRPVAVKVAYQSVFKDPVTGPKFLKMFLNEAALAGRLHHPHILEIYDAGVEDEFHYIVMEYVPGGTLEQFAGGSRLLPLEQSVEIAFKCAHALDYASRQGLIHRDIKPANILVSQGTEVKISDFGAALWMNPETTQVTGAVGSPLYMSPEQLKGQAISHQTDIYSLGVVLYQLLTGQPPLRAENEFALMHRIINDAPPPVSHLRPDVPGSLSKIVARAMEKDPRQRYSNWAEFAEALAAVYANVEPLTDNTSDTRKFNMLKTLAVVQGFSEANLWEFLRLSDWRRFGPGRHLIEEGRRGRSFYFLASGEANVEKNGKLIGVLKAGDSFGEMAFIRDEAASRTASVTTRTDALVIKVKGEAIARASDELRLALNRAFLRILADRLAKTDSLLAAL